MAEHRGSNEPSRKSQAALRRWFDGTDRLDRRRADPFAFLARRLPCAEEDAFTFLELGAGAGSSAARSSACTRRPRGSGPVARPT
jgi:hypothetical protein